MKRPVWPATEPWPRARADWIVLGTIGLGAFLVRLLPLLEGGGLLGILPSDDSVYYGGAVALINGWLPYRDFLLLHPPGILYLLSPFAVLGSVLGHEADAFAAARLTFMILGAANACLVALVAGRLGRTAAICAGFLYAVWFAPAYVEETTWLIGPQNTLLLLALLLLPASAAATTMRRAIAVGVLLGVATAIQLWAPILLAVVLVWLAVGLRRQPIAALRRVVACGGAALLVFLVLCLPFLLIVGGRFFELTVIEQLGRQTTAHFEPAAKVAMLMGLPSGGVPAVAAMLALPVVAIAGGIVAWFRPQIRLWAGLFAVQAVFLLGSDVFFGHYAGWLAPAAALSVGAVAATLIDSTASRWPAMGWRNVAGLAYAVFLVAFLVFTVHRNTGDRAPRTSLTADLSAAHCVATDYPALLLMTGMLTRDIANGCQLQLDSYGLIVTNGSTPAGASATANTFLANDAAMFVHLSGDPFPPGVWNTIQSGFPIQIQEGPVLVLLRTRPGG